MKNMKLKRIFRKGKSVFLVLESLRNLHGHVFSITDLNHKLLYGVKAEDSWESSVLLWEEEQIATIYAKEKVKEITDIVYQLLRMEQEKKDLANEVLDRYRELNLLYDVAEQLSSCHDVFSRDKKHLDLQA